MVERVQRVPAARPDKTLPLRTKRRLDFQSESVSEKIFYLDIVGNDELVCRLSKELTKRCTTVAQFFDKTVQVLVTSKDDLKVPSNKSPSTNPSPAASLSKPSPFSNSPLTPVEAQLSSQTAPTIMSRGQRALSLAKKRSMKTAQINLVTKANEWGIKVWSVKKMEEWLVATRHLLKSKKPTPGAAATKPKIRVLKRPFLKVEDKSREYRPLLIELHKWPLPNVSTHPEVSPYDTPRTHKKSKRSTRKSPKKSTVPSAKRTKTPVTPVVEKRSGYCECCRVYFVDLIMHLNGDQHLAYAANPSNYASLDQVISQGTSFQDFLVKYDMSKLNKETATPFPSVVPITGSERTPGFTTPVVPHLTESPLPVTPYVTRSCKNAEDSACLVSGLHSKRRRSTDDTPLVSPKKKKVVFSDSTPKADSGVQTGVVTRSMSKSSPPSGSPKMRTPVKSNFLLSPGSPSQPDTFLVNSINLSPISPPKNQVVQVDGLGPVVLRTPGKSPMRVDGPLVSLHTKRHRSTDEAPLVSPKKKKVVFSGSTPKADSGVQTGVVTRSMSKSTPPSGSPKMRTPVKSNFLLSPGTPSQPGTPSFNSINLSPISPPKSQVLQVDGLGPVVLGTPGKSPMRVDGPLVSLHNELHSECLTPTSCYDSFSSKGSSSSRRSLRILAKNLSQKVSPDNDWKSDQTKVAQYLVGLRKQSSTPTRRSTRRRH